MKGVLRVHGTININGQCTTNCTQHTHTSMGRPAAASSSRQPLARWCRQSSGIALTYRCSSISGACRQYMAVQRKTDIMQAAWLHRSNIQPHLNPGRLHAVHGSTTGDMLQAVRLPRRHRSHAWGCITPCRRSRHNECAVQRQLLSGQYHSVDPPLISSHPVPSPPLLPAHVQPALRCRRGARAPLRAHSRGASCITQGGE